MKSIRYVATLLYFLSCLLAYLLMLATMTYNVGIFFAAVFGLAAGYHLLRYSHPGEDDGGHCVTM